MSVAGNHSVNHRFLPNGRKRKLSPCSVSPHDKRQTRLKFTSEKRIRVSQEVPDTVNSELLDSDMAHTESNNKLPFANSFSAKASLNNHKKPGQGKKLVIKNRKGELPEIGRKEGGRREGGTTLRMVDIPVTLSSCTMLSLYINNGCQGSVTLVCCSLECLISCF